MPMRRNHDSIEMPHLCFDLRYDPPFTFHPETDELSLDVDVEVEERNIVQMRYYVVD